MGRPRNPVARGHVVWYHETLKQVKQHNEYYHYLSLCLLACPRTLRSQCQYPYADTQPPDGRTRRSRDDHRNHPHDPMTTPDDTTSTEPTTPTEPTNRTDTTTDDRSGIGTENRSGTETDHASPPSAPTGTPITESAGPPIVPTCPATTDKTATGSGTAEPTATGSTASSHTTTGFDTPRRPTRPPEDDERDAPLVPDLRPIRRRRTDGGDR